MSDRFNYRGTQPQRVMPHAQVDRLPLWRRLLGWIFLLLALLLILASAALALSAPEPAGDASLVARTTAESAAHSDHDAPAHSDRARLYARKGCASGQLADDQPGADRRLAGGAAAAA